MVKRLGRRVLLPVAFWLAVWELCYRAVGQDLLLASPGQVVAYLAGGMNATFWGCVGMSLVRTGAAYVLGVALGVALAVLCHWAPLLGEVIRPALAVVRATPVASFIILALILFSSRNLAVPISFLIVLPVLYSNVLGGIRAADSQLMEMARVFRIPVGRSIRYVYLPQVMPYFLSACGSALGLCWKSGIAAEVIGMPEGSIGEQLQQAKVYLDTPDLFAWTLVIVLVSLAFERAFLALLRRGARAMERM